MFDFQFRGRSDSRRPEPLSQRCIVGHIVVCVCCHEITFQTFVLLLVVSFNHLSVSCTGKTSCAEVRAEFLYAFLLVIEPFQHSIKTDRESMAD